MLSPENPSAMEKLFSLWPIAKFPMLMDEGRPIHEATIIIEHLQVFHLGPVCLISEDLKLAVDVRFMDRFFDSYISMLQQKLVFDLLRAPGERDPKGVEDAKRMLEKAYGWLDGQLASRQWAAGGGFSLADCVAAPALFYADWSHPIPDRFANVRAYRQRLNQRPSFARAIDEARPYRVFFPLGAPDRD